MALQTSDLLFKLSLKTGTAGNQSTQPDPNASLGKYISTTAWAGGVLHDLFDVVTGDENAASDIEYRCVFIHNNHATLNGITPVMWISAEVSGGAVAAIGVDPAAQTVIGSSSAQAAQITLEGDVPSGVSFSAPTSKATGISLGATLDAGKCRAIWIRRTAANTVAVDADGFTLRVECDSSA